MPGRSVTRGTHDHERHAPDHADVAQPILAGWFGHDAPFAFERGYRPAPGVARMRVGTPPVVALSILDAALDAWDAVDMAELRAAWSATLPALFGGPEHSTPLTVPAGTVPTS